MKMKGCLVLFALAISALATNAEEKNFQTLLDYYTKQRSDDNRIIDGSPASAGQFPWQVAVFFTTSSGNFFCGGALISDSYVLTAAHCASGALSFTLYLGGITLAASEEGRRTITTTTATVHPNYNTNTLNNDIALIRLPEPVQFTDRIQPVALASSDLEIGGGVSVTVSGWGKTSDSSNSVSQTLNYVQLTTITNQQCANVYGSSVIVSSTVCAVGNPQHSTCNGDSGGPLVIYNNGVATHVGVVSFVSRAGCASGNPSGYVRTSALREWIRENSGV